MKNFVSKLKVKKGETILLTEHATNFLLYIKKLNNRYSLNDFIDALQMELGSQGTLLIQTFDWDFCNGKRYFKNKKSKTSVIGNVALKREDFIRTNHPIYSFVVWGKYKKELERLNNIEAFDKDSPFGFIHKVNGKMLTIDLSLQDCFTYVHYVEKSCNVPYRYIKEFTSIYENKLKTYSMYVRDLNYETYLKPLENAFIKNNIMDIYSIDDIDIRKIELSKAYEFIKNDILTNSANSIHRKIGEVSV